MFELRCFGHVAVLDRAGGDRVLRSRKHVGLLLYLVANSRTTHTREELADLLWDGTGKRERHSLSQALYDIRSTIGDIVEVTTTTVRLLPDQIAYEVTRLEDAIEARDHDVALDLYRGEFAPEMMTVGAEMFDRWVDAERERCRVLATIALRNAQRAAEERGDWDRMCLAALRLLRLNTFDEESHCALMRGLWMKGDPASALRHFRSIDPDLVRNWDSVVELSNRIEQSGSVREVLTVPREPLRLMGREADFRQLLEHAAAYQAVGGVVVITGELGVGKTSVLTELARLLTARGLTVERVSGGDDSDVRANLIQIVDESGLRTHGFEGYRRPHRVVFVTSRDRTAADLARHEGVVDEVLNLERLTSQQVEELILERFPGSGRVAASACARLSGGNPRWALDIGRAVATLPVEPRTDEHTAEVALNESATLRARVDEWLHALPQPARELVPQMALFDPITLARVCEASSKEDLRCARDQLVSAAWLHRSPDEVRFAVPILRVALCGSLDARFRLALHEAAAAELRGGSPADEYAASREFLAAGKRRSAREAACCATQAALRAGMAGLASEAGRLASSLASDAHERVKLAFLSADGDLRQGRPDRAERTIRQVLHLSMDESLKLEGQLLLLGALLETEDRSGIEVEMANLSRLVAEVADPALKALGALKLAEASFRVSSRREPCKRTGDLAEALESALANTATISSEHPEHWPAAFRTLFIYRATETSVGSAEALLNRFGDTLDLLSRQNLGDIAGLSRPIVEMRGGRLQTGLRMAESIARNATAEDRFRTAALNNWGVALTEVGEFARAREVYKQASAMDELLRPPVVDRLHTILNHCQAAWFMGDEPSTTRLANNALRLARNDHAKHIEAEASVLLGLRALEAGDLRTAFEIDERLADAGPWIDRIQDRYLVHWFRGWISVVRGIDPTQALIEASISLAPLDQLASAKLMIIARHLGQGDPEGEYPEALRALRSGGAGWFARRVQRTRVKVG